MALGRIYTDLKQVRNAVKYLNNLFQGDKYPL